MTVLTNGKRVEGRNWPQKLEKGTHGDENPSFVPRRCFWESLRTDGVFLSNYNDK